MTTQVRISTAPSSNPAQELVIHATQCGGPTHSENCRPPQADGSSVLSPGDWVEFWASSNSKIEITERQSTVPKKE